MADPKTTLSYDQIRSAGLDDWRIVTGRLHARFRTGRFAVGLALVDRIGEAAEAANHHPDLTLSYPELRVTLSSHDVGGLTSRDVDLARQISGFAAEAGVVADSAGITVVELGLDTADRSRLTPYYAALLAAQQRTDDVTDPSGQAPDVWFQEPSDDGHPLPEAHVPQRWHLDVWVPRDAAAGRLQAVLDAGGRLVSEANAPSFVVVEDADGNRSCICVDTGR